MANRLKVTLVKSAIGRIPKHRKTVKALGFTKTGTTREFPDNDAIRGMLKQIEYMLKVEEI